MLEDLSSEHPLNGNSMVVQSLACYFKHASTECVQDLTRKQLVSKLCLKLKVDTKRHKLAKDRLARRQSIATAGC